MKIIGLTGGSGAGKSVVAETFRAYGVESIDTDRVYREVTAEGMPCLAELAERFGAGILDVGGNLNRRALAGIAFTSAENLSALNTITHKYILAECSRRIEEQRNVGRQAVIIDAPVLFESGFDRECDFVIAVTAEIVLRLNRIVARDGISEEQARRRIANQMSDAEYARRSDYVIVNNGGDDIEEQVRRICLAGGITREV